MLSPVTGNPIGEREMPVAQNFIRRTHRDQPSLVQERKAGTKANRQRQVMQDGDHCLPRPRFLRKQLHDPQLVVRIQGSHRFVSQQCLCFDRQGARQQHLHALATGKGDERALPQLFDADPPQRPGNGCRVLRSIPAEESLMRQAAQGDQAVHAKGPGDVATLRHVG